MPIQTEYIQANPLSPPLIVSGRVGEDIYGDGKPFEFTHGLAVGYLIQEVGDNDCHDYLVVMPNGRMYEINHEAITSARPWTPADSADHTPQLTETKPTYDIDALVRRVHALISEYGPMSRSRITHYLPHRARASLDAALNTGIKRGALTRVDGKFDITGSSNDLMKKLQAELNNTN